MGRGKPVVPMESCHVGLAGVATRTLHHTLRATAQRSGANEIADHANKRFNYVCRWISKGKQKHDELDMSHCIGMMNDRGIMTFETTMETKSEIAAGKANKQVLLGSEW